MVKDYGGFMKQIGLLLNFQSRNQRGGLMDKTFGLDSGSQGFESRVEVDVRAVPVMTIAQ